MRIEVKGELEELDLPELVRSVFDSKETGILHVLRENAERSLFFDNGQLIYATSTDMSDSFGAYLFREKRLPLRVFEELRGQVKPGKRFGSLMLDRGVVSAEELVDLVSAHLLELGLDLFTWGEGRYRFVLGEQPLGESILLEIQPENFLLRGMRRIQQWERIRKGLGRETSIYRTESWLKEQPSWLALEETDVKVAEMFTHGMSLEELSGKPGLDLFAICRSVWSLKLIRALEPIGPSAEKVDEEEPEPVIERRAEGDATAQLESEPSPLSPSPPEEIACLEEFNKRHTILYRVLRDEIGAGTDLFVSKCIDRLQADKASVFSGLEPGPDGGWDLEALRGRLSAQGVQEPEGLLECLLSAELEAICDILEPSKARGLRDELSAVESSEDAE